MATKQKLSLGGLLIAFMIVHAAKKEGERDTQIRTCVYWSPTLYKRLNTMEKLIIKLSAQKVVVFLYEWFQLTGL